MQEHIKRMAEKAGLIDHENAFGQLMITHGPYNDELQRFAQAVARECFSIVEINDRDWVKSLDDIRARFGIEWE